ncbi:hypothetical protein DXA73_17120, partial [Bacteroides uniformis]
MITSGIQSFALSHGEQYKHGRTSLRDLSGKLPFVANGCTMLLCVEGRAWKIQCKLPPKTKRFCPL